MPPLPIMPPDRHYARYKFIVFYYYYYWYKCVYKFTAR